VTADATEAVKAHMARGANGPMRGQGSTTDRH